MIKAVIFNADGVVINKPVIFSRKFSADYNIPYKKILPFFEGPFKSTLIGDADLKEILKPYLIEWHWEKSVDDFLSYWFGAEHHVDKRIIDYIKKVREQGIKCILATENEKYRMEYIKKDMGLGQIFDEIYSSVDLHEHKKAKEFYERLISRLKGVNKDEVFFWDDDIKNVEAAKEYGISAELYADFADFERKMQEYVKM